jgi:hypothetical protein
MNLRKVMFWKQPEAAVAPVPVVESGAAPFIAAGSSAAPAGSDPWSEANVIPMHRPAPIAGPGEMPIADEFAQAPAQPVRVRGLMNAPELEAFFKTNQFGFGRHHGSQYRTHEAMDRGLLAVVSSFQNIVSDLAERRQTHVKKLQQTRQEVATLSPSLADTLRIACDQVQREISVLNEQHVLAEQRKGWVLDALNRYQLGFDRGVREAVDFELLNV